MSWPELRLPFQPPLPPMLAKLSYALPEGDGFLFEPKWDGFRALVWKSGDEVVIQSRDLKPLGRYFPEVVSALRVQLPERCVLDGEIVISSRGRLDFEALLLRIHPAASRIKLLSEQTPASYVAWDLLALGDEDTRQLPQAKRRELLLQSLSVQPPLHLTPATRDRDVAEDWFRRFEGAGFDGVIAKPESAAYVPDKRMMVKVKHQRTADCAVAGFRWFKGGKGTLVGSLLLGLYDGDGRLQSVGICASFKRTERAALAELLTPLREGARENHPWKEWAQWQDSEEAQRMPGVTSRWNRDKELSWEPIRLGLVAEVSYDHMEGSRFRHATHFKRWRPDKTPEHCRYEQLETTPPVELAEIFSSGR